MAREKLEKLIQEGVTGLNEGRIQEAMAIAEAAVTADPSSVTAWSLKANCHERYGQIAEALECAEKVVELNPDSELDKIKRAQLRSSLMAQAQAVGPRSQRLAFLAATAVVGVLVCAAVIYGRTIKPQDTTAASISPQNVVARNNPLQGDALGPTQPTGQQQSAQQQGAPSSPQSTANVQMQAQPNDPGDDGSSTHIQSLPTQKGPSATDPLDPTKMTIQPSGAPTNSQTKSGVGSLPPSQGDPAPLVDNPPSTPSTGGGTAVITASAPPKEDPGQISITVHRGPNRIPNSGSQPVEAAAGGAQAFANTANQQYEIGNYVGASASLEKAIKGGGNAITLNQRLGQSYERQGLKSDAINAYQQCISACNAAIGSGRGDTAKAQRTKEACQDAIKLLQGG